MTARTRTRLAALLAASVVVLAGCGTEDDPEAERPQRRPDQVRQAQRRRRSPATSRRRASPAAVRRTRSPCPSTSSARRRSDRGCSASSATSRPTTRSTRRWRCSAAGDALDPDYSTPAAGRRLRRVGRRTTSAIVGAHRRRAGRRARRHDRPGGEAGRAAGRLHGPGRPAGADPGRLRPPAAPARRSSGVDTSGGLQGRRRRTTCSPSSTSPSRPRTRLVTGTFTASGVANSFEATVPWEIRDADGKMVLEGFATAEGGCDKLYPWESPVDVSAPGAGHLHVRGDDRRPVGRRGRRGRPRTPRPSPFNDGHVRLSPRRLNRTLLAPSAPARRAPTPRPHEVVGHLVGLQAQETCRRTSPWPRGSGLRPARRHRGLEDRSLVRLRPCAGPCTCTPPTTRWCCGRGQRRCTSGRSRSARTSAPPATSTGRRSSPRCRRCWPTARSPRRRSAQRWPRPSPACPRPLGQLARSAAPLVQLPPRGTWKGSGGVVYQTSTAGSAGRWSSPTCAEIVRRYLRAFGPATAADVTAWSGGDRARAGRQGDGRPGPPRGRGRQGRSSTSRRASWPTRTPRRRCGCSAPTTTSGSPTPRRDRVTDPDKREHWMGPTAASAHASSSTGWLAGLWRVVDGRVEVVDAAARAHQRRAVRPRRRDQPASRSCCSLTRSPQRGVRASSADDGGTPAVEVRSTSATEADGAGTGVGERGQLLGGQPALGADDEHHRPGGRHVELGERRRWPPRAAPAPAAHRRAARRPRRWRRARRPRGTRPGGPAWPPRGRWPASGPATSRPARRARPRPSARPPRARSGPRRSRSAPRPPARRGRPWAGPAPPPSAGSGRGTDREGHHLGDQPLLAGLGDLALGQRPRGRR